MRRPVTRGRPRRRATRPVGVAAALALLVASAAAAETPAPTPTPAPSTLPYFLGELVVSAAGDADRRPSGAVDTLDADDIRAAGAVSVGDALELLPGVSLSVGARNEQKIWLRGYEQTGVLLLLDGVPVSDPYSGDLDLGPLPVADVARITVTRGAASPLYGPNAFGGVVNVVTTQGGGEPTVSGELRATDHDSFVGHAAASGSRGPLSFYLGVGAESSDGWPLAGGFTATDYEDGGVRVNSDLERSSALARIGWRFDDGAALYASLRWVDVEKGIPFHTTRPAGFVRFARFPTWRQTTLAVGYRRPLASDGELRAQLYRHHFDNVLDVYAGPELDALDLASTFSDRVTGGSLIAERRLGRRHLLGVALHLRDDRHESFEEPAGGPPGPHQAYRAWTGSLAVEDHWRLADRLRLVTALAVDRLEVRQARSLRPAGGSRELVDDPVGSTTLVSPQAELQWTLADRWWASLAVSRRGRFPTLRQLYGTDPPSPGLDPQRTTGLEAGVAWSSGERLAVRGSLFSDRVRDLITRPGRFEPYANRDRARIDGLELTAEGQTGRLGYRASWTVLDHRVEPPSGGLDEIPYVPDHQLELMGSLRLGRRTTAHLSWLATGERASSDGRSAFDLAGYELLDAGLAVDLGAVEATVRADNLLDADVEQEAGFPLPGRRLWLGLRFVVAP